MAVTSPDLVTEFIPWDEFYHLFRWRQGEHLTALAPTGFGKTTLLLNLLPKRDGFTVVAATKRRDEQLDALKHRGYYTAKSVGDILWDRKKHIFRPPLNSLTDTAQAQRFEELLDLIFQQGRITFYADEVRYLTDVLKLRKNMEVLWLQGRSLKITIVAGSQRPAWVPLEAYSQATHLFLARTTDERDLKRVSDISGGIDRALIRAEIRRLPKYQFLYINTSTDEMCRTMVDRTVARNPRSN